MLWIKDLCSSSFDIATLNNELTCMAMIQALGPEYSHFTSSLALLTDLDKDKVKAAFQTEEINWRPQSNPISTSPANSALSASSATCQCPPNSPCSFCDKPDHCQCKCYSLQHTKKYYKLNKNKDRKEDQAQGANLSHTGSQEVVKWVGNASLHSSDPSDPFSPLQLDADHNWNTNLGATSHMTLHRHWLQNYTLKCVSIKLANNTIVYLMGVGSVVFKPVIDGKTSWAVKFSNVLHIPELQNNLLSVLYLTCHLGFIVYINATHMLFSCSSGPLLFIATINHHKSAFLDGMTQCVT